MPQRPGRVDDAWSVQTGPEHRTDSRGLIMANTKNIEHPDRTHGTASPDCQSGLPSKRLGVVPEGLIGMVVPCTSCLGQAGWSQVWGTLAVSRPRDDTREPVNGPEEKGKTSYDSDTLQDQACNPAGPSKRTVIRCYKVPFPSCLVMSITRTKPS